MEAAIKKKILICSLVVAEVIKKKKGIIKKKNLLWDTGKIVDIELKEKPQALKVILDFWMSKFNKKNSRDN